MSLYAKVTSVISVMVIAIAAVSMWLSLTIATGVVQKSLDNRAQDSAKLVALALSDVDLERDLDLVEYIINGAFNMGGIEQITLVDDMDRVKVDRKKAEQTAVRGYDMVVLANQEGIATITRNGAPNGKIVLKSDASDAYTLLETKMAELLKLFAAIGLGSIVLFAITLKLFIRTEK